MENFRHQPECPRYDGVSRTPCKCDGEWTKGRAIYDAMMGPGPHGPTFYSDDPFGWWMIRVIWVLLGVVAVVGIGGKAGFW